MGTINPIGLSRSEPWFVIGDLNEITGHHEKDGGAVRSADSKMSWQGRRGKGTGAVMVRCRLDRALANEE